MVQIRRLEPVVKIGVLRQPTTKRGNNSNYDKQGYRRGGGQFKVVVRRRVDYPPPTPQPTPCVLWQGAQGSDGYGWRKIGPPENRKSMAMHRWAMEQHLGRKLRKDEVVLHACDNRLCYRVDHLSVGTIADNNADMKAKGRAVKPPLNVFFGEAHPMAKLTEKQVRDIKGHYQSGLSIKSIAADYSIHPSTVRRIVKGMTWATGQTRDLVAEHHAREEARAAAERPPEPTEPVKFKIRRLKYR